MINCLFKLIAASRDFACDCTSFLSSTCHVSYIVQCLITAALSYKLHRTSVIDNEQETLTSFLFLNFLKCNATIEIT